MFKMTTTLAGATAASAVLAALPAAAVFDLSTTTDLVSPSFRGDSDTTYLGWDSFNDGDPGPAELIFDDTPDLGTDGGIFETTNGEDHLSSSGNFYSSTGSVSETITFDVAAGAVGTGYTTVIVQAVTLFGPFGAETFFSDIDGVNPTVVFGFNAAGEGQLFAKYEILGTVVDNSFDISSAPFSFNSYDKFTVDTLWSPTGFAGDSAVVPEPAAFAIALALGLPGLLARRRR